MAYYMDTYKDTAYTDREPQTDRKTDRHSQKDKELICVDSIVEREAFVDVVVITVESMTSGNELKSMNSLLRIHCRTEIKTGRSNWDSKGLICSPGVEAAGN